MTSTKNSELAEQAAQLLRAAAPAPAHQQAAALAHEAERLLGVEPVRPASTPALSAFERQRAAQAQEKSAGLIGRLRGIFGSKKP
jgi:hypothetical protein